MTRPTRGKEANFRHLLFVYGTLRDPSLQANLLRACRPLGRASTTGSLVDLGDYPALDPYASSIVHGEVWECPVETLAHLDTYEGVAEGLFRRIRIAAEPIGSCWAYVAGPALEPKMKNAPVIASGAWPIRGE